MIFRPFIRTGLMFHLVVATALGSISTLCFILALQEEGGNTFVFLLLLGLTLAVPLPLVVYRAYALVRASYAINREGLSLRWGLRAEDIPLPEVEWVRMAIDLASDLPMPWLRFPGAVRGTRNHPDLGRIEYMAAETQNLVLVATAEVVYAVSPADPSAFLQAMKEALEMGSPSPLASYSAAPGTFLRRVWGDGAARFLILLSIALALILLVATALVIPGRAQISLGYDASGSPMPGGPAERLFLLPALGWIMIVLSLLGGLYYYRKEEGLPLAYLYWGSGLATLFLLLAAILLMK
jgi:hypothetical protein